MTKEQLIDQLHQAIAPTIEKFAAQPSPEAAQFDDHRKKLEKQKADASKVFDEGSAAYNAAINAIDEELKGLKVDDRTQRKQNLQLAAEAMVTVGNMLRVPLKLRDTGKITAKAGKWTGSSGGGGKRTRKTNEQMEQETQQVLKALPGSKKDFVSKSEIAGKVGFDPQSALLKLKREGEAESNGVRGAGGGWRRA